MSSIALVALLALFAVPALAKGGKWSEDVAQNFANCCKSKGIKCVELCQHPPKTNFTADQRKCMMEKFPDYLHCATGGKDNRECCKAVGVAGKNGATQHCLDLCYDSQPGPDAKYTDCIGLKEKIARCNHDANLPAGNH